MLIPDEHKEIVAELMVTALDEYEERDVLINDEDTVRILLGCMGMAFSYGVAYGQADPALPIGDRCAEAFRLWETGRVR